MKDKTYCGWVYRTQGVPPYIYGDIKVRTQQGMISRTASETFPDDQKGALACAEWITEQLGRDDWKLEPMQFLGYRIVVPETTELPITRFTLDSEVR